MSDQGPVSAVELAAGIENGSVCPVDLVERTLTNIRASDPAIFTDLLEDRALTEAQASKQRRAAGKPFSKWDGIPIAWKDLFDIQGRVTTAGSALFRSRPPATQDADLVKQATAAGLVTVGCLNMSEFAFSALGINPHYGTPENPHGTGPARVPGGSSSSSGVAVARGLVPVTLGSDTGGSIRIPAALNGVVGFKGSSAAFSKRGVFPLAQSLDTLGPLAADVQSCIAASQILTGHKVTTVAPPPLGSLKFVVPTNIVFEDVQEAVLRNFDASVDALEAAGARIERRSFAEFEEITALNENHGYMIAAEALDVHWDVVSSKDAGRIDPRVLDRILTAKSMTARDMLVLQNARRRLIPDSKDALGDRIVLYPTTAITAPEIAPLEKDDDLYLRTNRLMGRNTALGNFLDWCGVTLPNGTDENDMPTGLLLSMASGRENDLLAAALAVEQIQTNHHP